MQVRSVPNSRRRGLTLVEVALSLGVLALILVGLMQLLAQGAENLRARAIADRMEEVSYAAKEYVKANFVDLMAIPAVQNGQAVLVPVAGPTGPAGSTLPSIQGAGFLSSSFQNNNSFGQQHALIVRRVAGQQRLEGVVTTSGGNPIPDRLLGAAAAYVGADAGFMFGENPIPGSEGVITGVAGGWMAPAATWSAGGVTPQGGRLMTSLAFAEGSLVGDYLHRIDIDIPEANTMRTNLNMANSEINNVDAIDGNGATIEMTSTEVRIGPNVDVSGYITAGSYIEAAGEIRAGDNISTPADVIGDRFFDVQNANYFVDPAGRSKLGVTDTNYLNLDTVLYNSDTGNTGGNTTRLMDRLPNYVLKQAYRVANGQSVPKPNCPYGGTAKITFSVITDSYRFASNVQFDSGYTNVNGTNIPNLINNEVAIARRYLVQDSGSSWRITANGSPLWNNTFDGLAMAYCYYPDVPFVN